MPLIIEVCKILKEKKNKKKNINKSPNTNCHCSKYQSCYFLRHKSRQVLKSYCTDLERIHENLLITAVENMQRVVGDPRERYNEQENLLRDRIKDKYVMAQWTNKIIKVYYSPFLRPQLKIS